MEKWIEKLDQEILKWKGTRYKHGECRIGCGVDCVRFVVAVLDALHGIDVNPVPILPPQTAYNNRRDVFKVVRMLLTRYPNIQTYAHRDKKLPPVEPGDFIVMRANEGPVHVGIAGGIPASVWHATNNLSMDNGGHVCMTGIGFFRMKGIEGIWRSTVREQWSELCKQQV